ncbi:polysaccharide biosynthesis protein [Albibacterium bauzanense]|uniref:FlaA1/EpsC-like NDP-sugar epimerase n=1 Tax=Albibacterium bauzanense TaxID=653929 RepID=A0A4V2PY84_9SPHI|nr:nucleoside-diphosphate sugar epimerase/dehydratase [Albibacterium bauzanense]TCK85011.1 FlaA1/EpsC-like NDP-sugar epimerase [Albibacterium bauzanense]
MKNLSPLNVNPIKNFLLNDKHLHPLIILFIDMVLISCAFTLSFFIVEWFEFFRIDLERYSAYIVLFNLAALPIIFLLKLHTRLLRFSNTIDLLHIFFATLIVTLLFLSGVLLFGDHIIKGNYKALYQVLIINIFVCSTLLIIFRLLAKSFYLSMVQHFSNKKAHRVLIYGSDKNAVLVKRALENDQEMNYIIEGFIDIEQNRFNSYVEQKKVYHFSDMERLKKQKNIDELLIVNENLDQKSKQTVIECCMRLGIQVLTIPPSKNWLSGKVAKKQIRELQIEDLLQRKPINISCNMVKKHIKGKRILITGAAGSIGSEIVRQVLSYKPSFLILCDNAESPLYNIQLEIEENFPNANIEIVIADVKEYDRMYKLFDVCRPEVVYHAAAYKHVPLMENNPFEAIAVNVGGTKNIADLSVEFDIEKFIMISTDKAVNPTNVMGASKRLAEIYTQSLDSFPHGKTRFITTRFGNVLGSNGSVIPRFRGQIEKGGPITVTHPEITRYFMTIPEAVQLVLEAETMGQGGEIFVFDMGKPVKILDMAKKMIQLAGLEEGKDIEIVFTGLRPGEKLYEELLASTELTIATHHKKINIARVQNYPYKQANKAIEELLKVNLHHNNEEVVRMMKKIVPEFLSKNSVYEDLDPNTNQQISQSIEEVG